MQEKVNQASKLLAKRAAQVQRGGARAAVLGVNDGLVSILCMVIGVGAAGANIRTVLLAGLAGTLAGAISMAAGEWISVKTQVELLEGVLHDLKSVVKDSGDMLAHKLAKNFEEHGVDSKTALHAAHDVARDDELLMSMYSSQVIGLNADELGSPWVAAFSSFALFSIGSVPPLLPWILGIGGEVGILWAISLTAFASLFVGGYTARSSGKNVAYGAVRQFLIVVFASAVTYGIGHLFGVAIS